MLLQGEYQDFGPDQFLRKEAGDDQLWADLAKELHAAQRNEAAPAEKAATAVAAAESMPHIDMVQASLAVHRGKEKASKEKADSLDAKARDRLLMFSGGHIANALLLFGSTFVRSKE